MASEKNQEILFVSYPDPHASLDNFKLQDAPTPQASDLNDGDILVKLVYASVDPYMRGRMNKVVAYGVGWELNKPPVGGVVCEVLETKNPQFAKGDLYVGYLPWRVYQIVPESATKNLSRIPDEFKHLSSYFIGACGMPGLSALLPIEKIADAKPGEVAFISGAAGAVGGVAGQLLKLKGLKVLGSAGSDEKVALAKELGFDEVFNYKTTNLDAALKEHAPNGIDVFFDNVGASTLETVLGHMRKYGRIIACGSIDNYDKGGLEKCYGVRNLFLITAKSLKMQGFIVTDWASEFQRGTQELVGLVKEGKLKVKETVREGFDKIPSTFLGLLVGDNQGGKVVIKI